MEAKAALQQDYDKRSQVPEYVWDVLHAMPPDSHPMCMFGTAVLVMERESVFRQWYDKGMTKQEYWVPALEDSLAMLARLPSLIFFEQAVSRALHPVEETLDIRVFFRPVGTCQICPPARPSAICSAATTAQGVSPIHPVGLPR